MNEKVTNPVIMLLYSPNVAPGPFIANHVGTIIERPWSVEESKLHINCKEMLAAFLALQTFVKDRKEIHVRLKFDNTKTVYYINRMGGTLSTNDTVGIQPVGLDPGKEDSVISRTSTW